MSQTHFSHPQSADAALALMAGGGHALAGATWAMRAPLRKEPVSEHFVSLGGIAAFRQLRLDSATLKIGPMVTHAQLCDALSAAPDLRGLADAAHKAANPGIRRIATLGGNLCAQGFAAADLIPALLALEAEVQILSQGGGEILALAEFLHCRKDWTKPWLLTAITVPRRGHLSAHARLTMRKAGDYPCAIVSLAARLGADHRMSQVRIGVGAVEPVARRWPDLEVALEGLILSPDIAESHARALSADFCAREAVDAPGWYRLRVLPVLLRRAVQSLLE